MSYGLINLYTDMANAQTIRYIPMEKASRRELGSEGIVTDRHNRQRRLLLHGSSSPSRGGGHANGLANRAGAADVGAKVGGRTCRACTRLHPAGTQRAHGVLEPAVLEGQKKGGCHRRDFTFGRAGFGRVGNVRQSRSFLFSLDAQSPRPAAAGASLAPNSKSLTNAERERKKLELGGRGRARRRAAVANLVVAAGTFVQPLCCLPEEQSNMSGVPVVPSFSYSHGCRGCLASVP